MGKSNLQITLNPSNMVLTSITTKLQKKNNQRASDIENNVAQTILEIQNGADAATKEQLMQLNINAVKEIDVGGRNALILMVPAPQVAGWQKVQTKILRQTRFDHRRQESHGQGSQSRQLQLLQAKTTNQSKCQSCPWSYLGRLRFPSRNHRQANS